MWRIKKIKNRKKDENWIKHTNSLHPNLIIISLSLSNSLSFSLYFIFQFHIFYVLTKNSKGHLFRQKLSNKRRERHGRRQRKKTKKLSTISDFRIWAKKKKGRRKEAQKFIGKIVQKSRKKGIGKRKRRRRKEKKKFWRRVWKIK